MKDKFVTDNFEINLSNLRINFTEENPRFKDSLWTKYTLPVDIQYDRDFLSKVGQYSSLSNNNLPQKHEGIHVIEGRQLKGVLEFLEFRNQSAKIQIDSGFEDLPNFDKKLSELPLEYKEVPDIYEHANEIVKLKYPETNYNFPKIYTDEFNLDSEGYKYFDSFINNRVRLANAIGQVFPRNEIEENANSWDCINRNIIHPVPYVLHVLKQGFLDAGFTLEGDILSDPLLYQRGIWSDKHYHTTAEQKYYKSYVYAREYYDDVAGQGGTIISKWKKSFKIDAPGKYRFLVRSKVANRLNVSSIIYIKKDGTTFYKLSNEGNTMANINSSEYVLELDIAQAEKKPEISFEFYGFNATDDHNAEGVNIGVAEIHINPMRQNTKNGDPIPFIFNENKVDLKRAVPDMTFGELVNRIKNWGNYDLSFENNIVMMNKIIINKDKDPEDFRQFEVADPIRTKNAKKYFYLKFPEVEGLDVESVFFDETGYKFNPAIVPKDTTEISIDGFCLPLATFRATTTAKAFKESALMLVYYDGLDRYGNNHATNPKGMHGREFAESVKDWYLNRLTNFTFKWTFVASRSELRNYNIRSEIFAYNKRHWIKSWVKNSISDKHYSIEIETETY